MTRSNGKQGLERLTVFEEPAKMLEMMDAFPGLADRAVRIARGISLERPDRAVFEMALIDEAARAGLIPKCSGWGLCWDEPGLVGNCRNSSPQPVLAGVPITYDNCPMTVCCAHCEERQPVIYAACEEWCPQYRRWVNRRRKTAGVGA